MRSSRAGVVLLQVVAVLAAAAPTPPVQRTPAPAATGAGHRLQEVQRQGDRAIDLRLSTLSDLQKRLAAANLTTVDRGALEAAVGAARTGLTALRAKLDAETAVASAAADVEAVYRDYRVYAVLQPQVQLAVADDALAAACAAELPAIERQLAAAIAAQPSAGASSRLADLQSQVAAACSAAQAAHAEIMGLTAAGWPADRAALADARAKLAAAMAAMHRAIADARAIVADLRGSAASPTPSVPAIFSPAPR